jgi:hypothetical protein
MTKQTSWIYPFKSFSLCLQPQRYKPADSFRAARLVLLAGGPGINRRNELIGKADCTGWIDAGCLTARSRALAASLPYCFFHSTVLRFSCLENKRATAVLSTPRQAWPEP